MIDAAPHPRRSAGNAVIKGERSHRRFHLTAALVGLAVLLLQQANSLAPAGEPAEPFISYKALLETPVKFDKKLVMAVGTVTVRHGTAYLACCLANIYGGASRSMPDKRGIFAPNRQIKQQSECGTYLRDRTLGHSADEADGQDAVCLVLGPSSVSPSTSPIEMLSRFKGLFVGIHGVFHDLRSAECRHGRIVVSSIEVSLE